MTSAGSRFLRLAACALMLWAGPALAGSGKVVVELFTSQGCSSCPPADAFLRELARRDDVVALSFHVDYWNYLGWPDPFSLVTATARQKDYRAPLGLRYVYTPQMIVNGTAQAVGASREGVLKLIEAARRRPALGVAVHPSGPGGAIVAIDAGTKPEKPAVVWAFVIDRHVATHIKRGENRGTKIVNANVVRAIQRIGAWDGTRAEIRLDLVKLGAAGRDACAIVIQQEGPGAILGATLYPFPKGPS